MTTQTVKPYSLEELEALLIGPESDLVERKESFKGNAPNKVREAVCAFCNDLPGHGRPGVVFVGAKDDGHPSGLAISDELLRQLGNIKTDGSVLPLPTLTVAKQRLSGADMIVMTVWPADSPPVRYKGRICIRTGAMQAIASAQDERVLNEKRRHRDRPYDIQPIAWTSTDDLDRRYFETEYLPVAVAPDILEADDRSSEQRLAATKMITGEDEQVPTVLGLLVTGKAVRDHLPGAYVQFLRIQGKALHEPVIDEELIDGTVADVMKRLDGKLVAHNRTAVDFSSAATESRRSLYPLEALQQLTRNAILHRNYEGSNTPVRVSWFDDHISILSPGGPFGEVTLDNFGTPELVGYRNPNLAEAMKALGYVQKFGAGISAAKAALSKNGNPEAKFMVKATHVQVILRPTA